MTSCIKQIYSQQLKASTKSQYTSLKSVFYQHCSMMVQESTNVAVFRHLYHRYWFVSGFDFGLRQNGQRVMDVGVPLWAKGSTRLFILIHRQVSRIRDNSRVSPYQVTIRERRKLWQLCKSLFLCTVMNLMHNQIFLGYYIATVIMKWNYEIIRLFWSCCGRVV